MGKLKTYQIEILLDLVDQRIINYKSVLERTGKQYWNEKIDELNELHEKLYNMLILNWYMKGFNDELKGTSTTESDDDVLNRAYRVGASDAIIGDDVSSIDYKSEEDILNQVKS